MNRSSAQLPAGRWRAALGPLSLILVLLMLSGPPTPAQEPDLGDENVLSLSGESLPVGVRLAGFTSFFVGLINAKSPSVQLLFQDAGLGKVDPVTVDGLAAAFGDFRERQQARSEKLIAASGGSYSDEVADSFVFERAEFLGGILGRWLSQVQREGHDVRRLLQHIVRTISTASTYGGDIPPYERIEKEGRLFEEAFEREFGTPLQALVAPGKEVQR